jgi:GxxExxY protein
MYAPLTDYEEYLANQVVDIAVKIHKTLGPGLLESVYETCFIYELSHRNIYCERQKMVPIIFESLKVEDGLRLDLLVENFLVVELKAQENSHPIWTAQLLSYLRLANKRIGFVINFHVTLMKDGIKRIVL